MLLTIQKKMICMLDQLSNLILNKNLCIIFVRNLTDMTGESQEEVLSDSTIALKQKSNSREESSITACDSQLERARYVNMILLSFCL